MKEAKGLTRTFDRVADEATAGQRVPPYVIFHDQTLADIARLRPATRAALLAIDGVGQGKLGRYGAAVLGLVAEGD